MDFIDTTRTILEHSPASFRPVVNSIRTAMRIITLCLPNPSSDPSTSAPSVMSAPLDVRQSAAELIAALPLAAGKAQSSAAWGMAVREAIGGMAQAVDGIARDGWDEGVSHITMGADPRTGQGGSACSTAQPPCIAP